MSDKTTPARTPLLVGSMRGSLPKPILQQTSRPTWRRVASHRLLPTLEVVPVNGHWPSSRFSATLPMVGLSRSRCSEERAKPKRRPPQPAKMKSIPTNIIMSLVGMVGEARQVPWSWKRMEEPSGVLSSNDDYCKGRIVDTEKRKGKGSGRERDMGLQRCLEH